MAGSVSPETLILDRAAAFRAGNFAFIYDSYPQNAPFRQLFPDRSEYLAYAQHSLAGSFRIDDCAILRVEVWEVLGYVLFRQLVFCDGMSAAVVEIARCRLDDQHRWRYESGLKLEAERLPANLLTASWADLEQAGSGLWI